jgi:tetratricopeptide (TPR) repeat protein
MTLEAQLARAEDISDEGDNVAAVKAFAEAVKQNPADPRAYIRRGQVNLAEGAFKLALADFQRAQKLQPDSIDVLYGVGDAYAGLQRPIDSIAAYDRVIALAPDYGLAYLSRAAVCMMLEDISSALANAHRAAELLPGDVDVFLFRGWIYYASGDHTRAQADHDRAIELAPNVAHGYAGRGRILLENQEFDRALADLNRAIELDPEHTMAYQSRAELYRALGDERSARADSRKASSLEKE